MDCLQLVQLPLSVYDQRLMRDGTVTRLQDLGIAVHVRSVLLRDCCFSLLTSGRITCHLRSIHHARWLEHLHQAGLSPLAGALGFVRACEGVEAVLVGVVAGQELAQVLEAWSQAEVSRPGVLLDWAWDNAVDFDPRRWPPRS